MMGPPVRNDRLSKKRLRMSTYRLEKLFTPRSIAIVGISPRPDSVGHIVLKNLRSGGFAGELYLVDPHHDGIDGIAAVSDFESLAPVHLKNLTVRNCCGLRTQGFFMPMGPVALENVLFEGNTVSHSSFNSVYQIGAKGFDIIDSVFVYGYPWEFHPNGTTQMLAGGITGDATVRNEVRNNEFGWAGDYPGRPDGCAYDFEGSTGSVTFDGKRLER